MDAFRTSVIAVQGQGLSIFCYILAVYQLHSLQFFCSFKSFLSHKSLTDLSKGLGKVEAQFRSGAVIASGMQ